MTAMISRFLSSRGRSVLLLLAMLVIVALAACSGGAANRAPAPPATAPAGSVQDQLAQLAAGAATATAGPIAPTATQSSPVLQPKPTRTRRPSAAAAASPRPTRGARATRTPTPSGTIPSDNLPTISQAQLPPEAQNTVRLIEQGGPFPYSRDGVTFENREGLLPKHPSGYYKEYTVVTPGSADRGARRIIAGRDGELYYTDDHYDSFKRVVP